MFEKLLLITGLAIGVVGFVFINFLFQADNNVMTWQMLHVVFIWLLLIFVVILSAIQENQREEIGIVIQKQSEETRVLRQIMTELHEETKLMRIDLSYTHNQIVDAHKSIAELHKSTAVPRTIKGSVKTSTKKAVPKKKVSKKKSSSAQRKKTTTASHKKKTKRATRSR